MKPNHLRLFLVLAALLTYTAGCTPTDAPERRDVPDVSGIDVNVRLRRFERDLFALDTNQLDTGMQGLALAYPNMLPVFTVEMIHDLANPSETPLEAVRAFVTAPPVRRLYDTVQAAYPDLAWLENDLTSLFRYHKHYFPDRPTPEVVTMISEYAIGAFTYGDSLCGIGLDMFLGPHHTGYNPDDFPAYIRRQCTREHMVVRLAKAIAQNHVENTGGNRLLDEMIAQGKILYITDCLVPFAPDSLKMGYTAEQMAGCINNEAEVWGRILEEKLLYSSDRKAYRKLVEPSPNAPVVFQEAPGEIGSWIGWRIVAAYMKRHPGTTIDQLMALNDAQKLLEASKYKPRRTVR